jgi:hypothetical protein
MTAFAELNGTPISKLHLVVPALGLWHADVVLVSTADLTGLQTLVLSGSTWKGTPIRAVNFSGSRSVRIVGGAAGWRKKVSALQYSSPAGVPTATVVNDAASLVGELPPVLDPSVPQTVGTGYVRQAGPASLVLQHVVGDFWWVDPGGTVQTMPRPSTAIKSAFVAEDVRGAPGLYRVASEFPGQWLPGATFSGPTVSGTISRIEHRIDRGKIWSEISTP